MTENLQRIVMDTNTLISAALFPQSFPGQTLDKVVYVGLLLFSEATFAEFEEVLFREKFNSFLSDEKRKAFVEALKSIGHLVEIKERVQACRDPKKLSEKGNQASFFTIKRIIAT